MCCLLDDLLTLKTWEYFFLHLEILINDISFKDLLFLFFQDFFIKFSEPHGKKNHGVSLSELIKICWPTRRKYNLMKAAHMRAQSRQSCLTLCDSMDYSPPGSSVHGILQARMLEWDAMPFSRLSSQPRGQTHVSCIGRQVLYHQCHLGNPWK